MWAVLLSLMRSFLFFCSVPRMFLSDGKRQGVCVTIRHRRTTARHQFVHSCRVCLWSSSADPHTASSSQPSLYSSFPSQLFFPVSHLYFNSQSNPRRSVWQNAMLSSLRMPSLAASFCHAPVFFSFIPKLLWSPPPHCPAGVCHLRLQQHWHREVRRPPGDQVQNEGAGPQLQSEMEH